MGAGANHQRCLEDDAFAFAVGRPYPLQGQFSGVLPDVGNDNATVQVQLTGLGALNLPDRIRLEISGGRCRLCSCPETS